VRIDDGETLDSQKCQRPDPHTPNRRGALFDIVSDILLSKFHPQPSGGSEWQ